MVSQIPRVLRTAAAAVMAATRREKRTDGKGKVNVPDALTKYCWINALLVVPLFPDPQSVSLLPLPFRSVLSNRISFCHGSVLYLCCPMQQSSH